MYTFAICDDEPLFAEELAEELAGALDKLLGTAGAAHTADIFNSGEELLRAVEEERKYHAVFLDILMDGKDGVETAKELRARGFAGEIVFVSCSGDFALPSFEVAPMHYLLKPIRRQDICEALRRIFFRGKNSAPLVIRGAGKAHKVIPPEDVMYIEVFRTQIVVHQADGLSETGVGALRELHSRLGEGSFYRCHRSFIINFDYISGIRRYEFVLKNGMTVPIAKNRYDKALLAMTNYLK